jgi:hypothetical protein
MEPYHAVVYFAPDVKSAFEDLGVSGFWRGYFASRAAPMGPVTAEVVIATFYNFHPDSGPLGVSDTWAAPTARRHRHPSPSRRSDAAGWLGDGAIKSADVVGPRGSLGAPGAARPARPSVVRRVHRARVAGGATPRALAQRRSCANTAATGM